ncbi:MAG: DUF429 domain-containing protein [Solirubrobacteraceae bacterium]
MIRTLGIDLASQDKNTAICSIQWTSGMAVADVPVTNVGDDALVTAMASADWTGIDAPFGWPDEFVAAIHGYATANRWPEKAPSKRMRFRETDAFVHGTLAAAGKRVSPLSVSSERIAACAWRCARLLTRFSSEYRWTLDRVGVPFANGVDGPPQHRQGRLVAQRGIVEVYPAAALATWGVPYKGYKTRSAATASEAEATRTVILDEICAGTTDWLIVEETAKRAMLDNDHALDAFVCSLVTYAAATGETHMPDINLLGAARREGWIHVPISDSLHGLVRHA